MGENEFWVTVWKIIAAVVIAIALALVLSEVHRDYQRTAVAERMIEKGVSPAGIACATAYSTTICAMLAAQTGK